MADAASSATATETENTPLLPTASESASASTPSEPRPLSKRSVTFNANPVSRTIEPEPRQHQPRRRPPADGSQSAMSTGNVAAGPPMLAALNSKLRRRGSQGTIGPYGTGGGASAAGNTGNAAGLLPVPGGMGTPGGATPKMGPQRSTKNAQKLKLLPTPEIGDDGADEESGRDVYSQYTRIKDPTARRDAARLGKADRDRLPRVTAYCTANRYQMDGLMRFLKGSRGRAKGANPKLIDECIYTPYCYRDNPPPPRYSIRGSANTGVSSGHGGLGLRGIRTQDTPVVPSEPSPAQAHGQDRRDSAGEGEMESPTFRLQEDLIDLSRPTESNDHGQGHGDGESAGERIGNGSSDLAGQEAAVAAAVMAQHADIHGDLADERSPRPADFDIHVHTPEVFLFDYGVVVIWGMTTQQEARFLKEIAKFETEKLAAEEVETEYFNFYYTSEYQPRIYNDFITLRDKNNYMTKLAISHALAQSVKTSLFEELIASTIDTCKDIPTQIALTGKIALSRTQINMQIGELFILRISIHLNGSVLDTPELFWVEPQLEPVYQAVRSYLEMDQRVGLLTERLDVIADLLAVLKDQLSHGHGEKLEWIVIVLIAAEILVAAVNIVVDLYAGVD